MKKLISIALAGIILLSACFAVYAAGGDGRVDKYTDGFRVGSNGTKVNLLTAGTLTLAANATVTTGTITNAATGDIVVITPAATTYLANHFYASTSTGLLTITADTAPTSGTVVINYLIIGKP